jgi:hypothetical protein
MKLIYTDPRALLHDTTEAIASELDNYCRYWSFKKKKKVNVYGPISASLWVHTFIRIALRRPYINFPDSDLKAHAAVNSATDYSIT